MKREHIQSWGWVVAIIYTIFMVTVGDVNSETIEEPTLTQEELVAKEKKESVKFRSSTVGLFDKNAEEVARADKELDYDTIDSERENVIVLGEEGVEAIKLRVAFEMTPINEDISLEELNLDENLFVTAQPSANISLIRPNIILYEDGILIVEVIASPAKYMDEYNITTTELSLGSRDNSVEHKEDENYQFMFGNNKQNNFIKTYEFEEWIWE